MHVAFYHVKNYFIHSVKISFTHGVKIVLYHWCITLSDLVLIFLRKFVILKTLLRKCFDIFHVWVFSCPVFFIFKPYTLTENLVILKQMYIESYLNKTLDDFRFWLASKIEQRCWPYAWTKVSGTSLNELIPLYFQKGRLLLIACLKYLLEGEPNWADFLNPNRAKSWIVLRSFHYLEFWEKHSISMKVIIESTILWYVHCASSFCGARVSIKVATLTH